MIDLKEIFKKISDNQNTSPNSKVLLVDGLNCFLRAFTMMNKHTSNGQHIGGVVGFLKSIGYAIKLTNATKVILVFDGVGGSDSRKNLYPEYKGNRSHGRVINHKVYNNKVNETDSLNDQMEMLIKYLKLLPVHIICVDGIEADDTISYLNKKYSALGDNINVTIMSSDKDFLQMVDSKTHIYSPTKKKIYSSIQELKDEIGTTPKNYIIYKTLMGDKSDNIPGISGLGEVKLFKLFPELKEDNNITLNQIFDKCEQNREKNNLYEKILERKKQLEINIQIMDLNKVIISNGNIDFIENGLAIPLSSLNCGIFEMMLKLDKIDSFIPNSSNWLLQCFNNLNTYTK